jgi:hypothetical protein
MTYCGDNDVLQEHGVLLRQYGAIQQRYSAQAQCLSQEIEQLQAQLIRTHAKAIVRVSVLAWEREDRRRLAHAAMDAPTRGAGARAADYPAVQPPAPGLASVATTLAQPDDADPEQLERSLRSADLVICQTGCVSHGSFWRVADHCKRTGKTCVLVEQPGALTIVRLRPGDQAEPSIPSLVHAKGTL